MSIQRVLSRSTFAVLVGGLLTSLGCYPGDPNCSLFFTDACIFEPPWQPPDYTPLYPLEEVIVTACRWPLIDVNGQCMDPSQVFPPFDPYVPGPIEDPGGGDGGTTTPVADPQQPPRTPDKNRDFRCDPPALLGSTRFEEPHPIITPGVGHTHVVEWPEYKERVLRALDLVHNSAVDTAMMESPDTALQTKEDLSYLADYIWSGGTDPSFGIPPIDTSDFAPCLADPACAAALAKDFPNDPTKLYTMCVARGDYGSSDPIDVGTIEIGPIEIGSGF